MEGRRSFPQVSPRPSPRRPLPPMRPGGQGEGYRQNTEVMVEEEEEEEEEEGCGPECRNLLHEVPVKSFSAIMRLFNSQFVHT